MRITTRVYVLQKEVLQFKVKKISWQSNINGLCTHLCGTLSKDILNCSYVDDSGTFLKMSLKNKASTKAKAKTLQFCESIYEGARQTSTGIGILSKYLAVKRKCWGSVGERVGNTSLRLTSSEWGPRLWQQFSEHHSGRHLSAQEAGTHGGIA